MLLLIYSGIQIMYKFGSLPVLAGDSLQTNKYTSVNYTLQSHQAKVSYIAGTYMIYNATEILFLLALLNHCRHPLVQAEHLHIWQRGHSAKNNHTKSTIS